LGVPLKIHLDCVKPSSSESWTHSNAFYRLIQMILKANFKN